MDNCQSTVVIGFFFFFSIFGIVRKFNRILKLAYHGAIRKAFTRMNIIVLTNREYHGIKYKKSGIVFTDF